MLVAVAMASAGCDAHSKPIVASPLPSHLSTGTSPSAAVSPTSSPLNSPGSPSATDVSPTAPPSAASSQYPDATAKIPAAVQTVRDYFNAFNHVIDTGDENEVVRLFAPDCTKCIDDVTSVQKFLDGGYTLRGGHVHLSKVIRASVLGSSADSVEVSATQDPGDQLDSSGKVIQHFPGGAAITLQFDLDITGNTPIIYKINWSGA